MADESDSEADFEDAFDADVAVSHDRGPTSDGRVEVTVTCAEADLEDVREQIDEVKADIAFETWQ